MPKAGLVFDYDLMANKRIADMPERPICKICDSPLSCRWTDLNGEGVCLTCGCAYQLSGGTPEQEKENKYPYINIKDEWIPILQQYWRDKKMFVFSGCSIGEDTGRGELNEWLKENHPEMIKA